jgi:hypothetical protein
LSCRPNGRIISRVGKVQLFCKSSSKNLIHLDLSLHISAFLPCIHYGVVVSLPHTAFYTCSGLTAMSVTLARTVRSAARVQLPRNVARRALATEAGESTVRATNFSAGKVSRRYRIGRPTKRTVTTTARSVKMAQLPPNPWTHHPRHCLCLCWRFLLHYAKGPHTRPANAV